MAKVRISCDGIGCNNHFDIDIPDWHGRLDEHEYGGNSSYLFCTECKKQMEFFDSVCPGCIAGFPECGLGEAFMYSGSTGLTGEQRRFILDGTCPFRAGGTYYLSPETGFIKMDLSKKSPPETGQEVLCAIDRYFEKYHKREEKCP